MKTPVILLLTNDGQLEDSVAQALSEISGVSHLTNCASEALERVCGVGRDLDLAVIDFEHCANGISLLTAISMYRNDMPVIAIIPADERHLDALTHACGATICLPKPVSAAQILKAMKRCRQLRDQSASMP